MIRILVAMLLLTVGCASKPRTSGRPLFYPLLPPATFGGSAEFEHVLKGEYGGRSFSLHALVKVDESRLLLIGLTPMNTRAFTVGYDGQRIEMDNPAGVRVPFPPEVILSDVQQMFWPSLPDRDGWQVKTNSSQERQFLFSGRPISSVRFGELPGGRRTIDLTNGKYNYRLFLEIVTDTESK
jgi:hypothetical protein